MEFERKLISKENDKELVTKLVERLSEFDTDGYSEYPKEKFNKYIFENKINVPVILDSYLNNVNLLDKFSTEEIKYIEALRAWLHCSFDEAKKYIYDKFDFRCDDNKSFVEKYRFFNTVGVFIFENKDIFRETEITQREKFIFDALQEKSREKNGSFLLNYLASDYISVIKGEKSSVQENEHIDWTPYEIAPKIYAFDSKNSIFSLINKNNLKKNSLYISKEKDFETINSIIRSSKKENITDQKSFDKLVKYFSVLRPENLKLNSELDNLNELELYLFRELQTKYNRINLREKTGIDFSKISLAEQRYFINYLKFVDNNFLKKVTNFNEKYKENGLRTFLSIEQGGKEMGGKIIDLGEKLPEEIAKKVFIKYGEIINIADDTQQILEEILPKNMKEESSGKFNEIKDSLLVRAKDLLVSFYDRKDNNPNELLKSLERYKTEILLYADTYKKLNQSGEKIKLEEIKNTEITILSQKEKEKLSQKLWDITIANRSFIQDEEKIKKRKEEFFKSIRDVYSDFYVLQYGKNNDIMAFCSFTPDKNGDLYAESLNVESEIKGSQIGSEFFPAVLGIVKKLNKDIYGYVHGKNEGTLPYYRRIGFSVIKKQIGGELKYEIRIPAEQNIKLAA